MFSDKRVDMRSEEREGVGYIEMSTHLRKIQGRNGIPGLFRGRKKVARSNF